MLCFACTHEYKIHLLSSSITIKAGVSPNFQRKLDWTPTHWWIHHKITEVNLVCAHHLNRQDVVTSSIATSVGRNSEMSACWFANVHPVLWVKNLYLFGPQAWEDSKEGREELKLFAVCNINFLCYAETM